LDVKGAFERHMAREPRNIPEEMKESVLIDLKIEVGAVILTAKELKKIKKGDFVVLDRKTHLLTLRGKPIYNVHIAEDQVRLSEVATIYEESMTELKELEMTVTVELAKLTMSLGELMKLSPGTTLDVPVSAENVVTLSVNGQAVGKAELVSLGDTQGLRILEIG
jgi:type III secretion system YscQ/HrcQ family protein